LWLVELESAVFMSKWFSGYLNEQWASVFSRELNGFQCSSLGKRKRGQYIGVGKLK
jgi:hypothetical protein